MNKFNQFKAIDVHCHIVPLSFNLIQSQINNSWGLAVRNEYGVKLKKYMARFLGERECTPTYVLREKMDNEFLVAVALARIAN